jgi:hypothetical protein
MEIRVKKPRFLFYIVN